jgi:hypothetical protein
VLLFVLIVLPKLTKTKRLPHRVKTARRQQQQLQQHALRLLLVLVATAAAAAALVKLASSGIPLDTALNVILGK